MTGGGERKCRPEGQGNKRAPWDRANLFEKYLFSLVLPMIKLAWRNQLEMQDLPATPHDDLSRTLGERLERNYQTECTLAAANRAQPSPARGAGRQSSDSEGRPAQARPSFLRALFMTFGLELALANLFNTFTRTFLYPLQTIALGWLLADVRRYSNLKVISDVFVDGSNELALRASLNSSMVELVELPSGLEPNAAQPAAHDTVQLERNEIYGRILGHLGILVATTCLIACLLHPFYFWTYHLGMKCRVAACHLIYKKALKLNQLALGEASAGQMINLLSNDVSRFERVVELVPFLVESPVQVILITFILSKYYLGIWPTLVGLLVVLMFMLLQGTSGKLFSRFRAQTARRSDERVRLMSEIIQAIKVIKMYAWERAFWGQVMGARRRELKQIQNTFMIRVLNQSLFFMSSKIIVFSMLMFYVLLGTGPLDPELVFVTIGLANLIRTTTTMHLANSIAQCAEALISCKRINEFLQLPELQQHSRNELNPTRQHHKMAKFAPAEGAIKFERAYAWWTSKEQMVMRNLNLTIEAGQLVLLVGRVGAGKSSVLLSVLGELPLASGRLEISGELSFGAQEAWLFAGTIRDNILFGEPLELARYQEVVRVCCLEHDFKELLERGDQTLVGERGAGLSGGQRARVNLARALYRRADIYLLDDPLAALDAPVARRIMSECFGQPNGFLLGKTVLLATHQLQAMRWAQKVLLLDQLAPAMFGSASELLNSDKFRLIEYARQAFEDAVRGRQPSAQAAETPESEQEEDEDQSELDAALAKPKLARAMNQLNSEELDCGVASDRRTYLFYLANAFTAPVFIWFLLILIGAQAAYLWVDYMLSRWTDAREQLETLGQDLYQPSSFMDLWSLAQMVRYYALSILCGLLAALLASLTFAFASIRASRRLHQCLLSRLLHGQMAYFESTSIGSLLNRVSRDLGFVDQTLPLSALDISMMFANILAVILLTVLINPWNAIVATGLLAIALTLRSLSLCAITRLKQLEGMARSPVFAHLSASLNGLTTIRAFQAEASFRRQFDQHQDRHSSAWFAFMCTTRWLGQAMDWASVTFVSIVLIGVIVFQLDSTPASLIGLLISHSVYMPGLFQAAMRQLVEAESQMTSVQRLKQICELPVERDDEQVQGATGKLQVPLDLAPAPGKPAAAASQAAPWLSAPLACPVGCIKFVDLTLRYANTNEPVLRQLNLLIRPRERVGIVGRTGAGKSSIIGALFRLYPFEGRIEIDGHDTRSLPLAELRNSMSIIPQEPVLFAGTLRQNLDPFKRYSDAELWRSLEAVQLGANLFARHPQGLEFAIQGGGQNLSVGQRQLLCLARAILRQNKILLLDEATASVDVETDRLIQTTIRQQFNNCTVLTIAHRLLTIVDSDRVLVLERGRVSEFGEPHELAANERGAFAQLIASSGQQAPRLRRLIEEAQERKLAGRQ